ncbi:MAG: CBS domain-containing protein [Methylocystaceae bacterium]|nr:CBS domain-containing protein [Methylocystaceae bacterium]
MLYFEEYATVQDVLNLKVEESTGHQGVLSMPQSATLDQLIDFMNDYNIGAVLIRNRDKQIVGLITERDVIHYLALYENTGLNNPLWRVMNTDVKACEQTEKLKKVAHEMAELNVRHMAVKNRQGDYIGVVSSRDIERFAGDG